MPTILLNHQTSPEAPLGGKGHGLLRLLKAGVSIPRTVCIPPDVDPQKAVLEAMEQLEDPGAEGHYAVRSSGFGEDGRHKSFAGQLESYLRVSTIAGLVSAVQRARLSGSNKRVLAYAGEAIRVSVLVQPMQEADYAGVLFTCDPVGGSRNHVVLEVVPGTAEHLVEGTVVSTRFVFTKSGQRLSQDGPLDFNPDSVIHRALEIEKILGDSQPLDFEWTLTQGELVFVQVRPATAVGYHGPAVRLLGPGESPDVQEGQTHWTSVNAREALPGVATPLTQDLCCSIIATGFSSIAERLGAPSTSEPIADFFEGRAYLNLNALFELVRGLPLENPDAIVHTLLTGHNQSTRLRFHPRLIPRLFRLALEVATIGIRFRRTETTELHRFNYLSDADRLDLADLGEKVESLFEMRTLLSLHALGSGLYTQLYGKLEELCQGFGQTASQTLQGLGSLRFGSSAGALRELALWAPEGFFDEDGQPPQDWPGQLERHPSFRDALERFLEEFGHLGSGSFDFEQPLWREDRGEVLKLVGGLIRQGQTRGQQPYLEQLTQERKLAIAKISRAMPFPARLQFRLLLKALHWAAPMRENMKFMAHRRLAIARGYLLEAGGRTWPGAPECVFFLRLDELKRLFQGTLPARRMRVKLDRRRAEYRAQQRKGYPLHRVADEQGTTLFYPAGHSGDELKGLGASGGVVTARARVIRDLRESNRLQPGEILVTTTTDPCWTPLFSLAAGIAVEVGSTLSHGAVVAREVGIPAVIGVPGLVSAIEDGEELTLDGSSGTIRRLRSSAPPQ